MVDDVLVDRRARCDEDGDAGALPPAGPAELLPRGGHRTRVAGQDRDVEAADVDAQLERVGRDDTEDLAVAQPALDRSAFGRQVAAAIAPDAAVRPIALAQRLPQAREQQLDRDPRPPEHDRLATGPEEGQRPALGQGDRRSAGAAGRFHDRWVDQQHVPLAGRGAVPIDEPGRATGQHRRQLGGVPDGRRAAHDDRATAVVGTDPEQPAEHVGDVAAEHAAVRVQLVDHDQLELLEQLEPLRVVRQDRRMEHVRVGHDDLPGRSHGRPDRRRRVAVVRRGDDRQLGRGCQLTELGDLVLAEGLGREEEQCPGRRVLGDGLQGWQRVAQRLARRSGRHDHDVLAGMDRLDRLGLVGVEAFDAPRREALDDAAVQPWRHVGVGRLAGWDDLVVDHAARERWLVEEAREDGRWVGGGVGAHRLGSVQSERMFGMEGSLDAASTARMTGWLSRPFG